MTENTQRIAELQRELAANPASRQFYQLGELLRRDGRFGEAAEVLNAGLPHHPRYMAAWVALGRACLENGKAQDAVRGLEQALVLDPQNPVAWRLLGEARLVLGSRLGALDAMTRCLDLVPGDDVLQAAVDALAAETAPPEPPPEYAPMLEAAGTPPESVRPVGELEFELELPEAAPAAPEAVPAPAAPPPEALDVFGAAPPSDEPFAGAGAGPETPEAGPFDGAVPGVFPGAAFELGPQPAAPVETLLLPAQAVVEAPIAPAAIEAPPAPEVPPPQPGLEEAAPPRPAAPVEAPAEPSGAPAAAALFEPPASIALARLYLQQQAPDEAVQVLERLLEREPANDEARDLLALVHDMMMPLPAAPPPLSSRERKIAALQRWLASLTLGWERAGR